MRKVFVLVALGVMWLSCNAQPIQVFVSILPLKYFVQQIGGKFVRVSVMVQPGYSPELYSPTPRQIAALSRAKLFYKIGVPYEQAWLPKLTALYPHLTVIDLAKGIEKINNNPHIWNSPLLAQKIAENIEVSLERIDSKNREFYQHNYQELQHKLKQLNLYIKKQLRDIKKPMIMVYHPAWLYFTRQYGLRELAIERNGKEPGPRQLEKLLEMARQHRITTIFVEPEFSEVPARAIAREIGAKLVALNPLAENYLLNMRQVAAKIYEHSN